MVGSLLGSIIPVVVYAALVGLGVRLTGWHVVQPGSSRSLERLRVGHHPHPWARLWWAELVLVVLVGAAYPHTSQLTHRWLHLPAYATVVILALVLGVVATSLHGARWFLVVGLAGLLGWLVYAVPGTLTVQLLVGLAVLAIIGKAARLPVWFGQHQPRYSLISAPLALLVLINALAIDLLARPVDVRFASWLSQALPAMHPVSANSASTWNVMLYGHHYYSLGVATPVAAFFLLTVMAVWARQYNQPVLISVPLVSTVAAMVIGLGVAIFTRGGNNVLGMASPWIAGGLIAGVIGASRYSQREQLIMEPSQDWHGDQTYKFFG